MMRWEKSSWLTARDAAAGEALAQGVNIERLVSLPVREAIGRFKYTEEADLDKVYEDVIKTLESEINSELSRKEDF